LRIALDTNVLVYAKGVNGEERSAAATRLLKRLGETGRRAPVYSGLLMRAASFTRSA
jgi:predicted nucleic acid-binding protein